MSGVDPQRHLKIIHSLLKTSVVSEESTPRYQALYWKEQDDADKKHKQHLHILRVYVEGLVETLESLHIVARLEVLDSLSLITEGGTKNVS